MTNKHAGPRTTLLLLGAAALLLSACQGISIDALADGEKLVAGNIAEAKLPVRYLERVHAGPLETLRVYFGGDGRPWVDGQISDDPTGREQLGLKLFLADAGAAIYLGRPCYHGIGRTAPGCEPTLWTSARYGPAVVQAMSSALAQLRQKHGAREVELIGYSGGATLAILVAARDPSVIRVVTVAPLLDIEAWTEHHRLRPLHASLSPLDAVDGRVHEELHLIGGRDEVVPPGLALRYASRRPHARFRVLDHFDHRCCWLEYWPALLEAPGAGP